MIMKVNGCIFFIEDDELLKKYSDIWNEVINSVYKKLIASPSVINNLGIPK